MKAAFRLRSLLAGALGGVLIYTTGLLPAQITPGTTQPEPQPRPIVPSPRDDDADFSRDEGDPIPMPGPRQPVLAEPGSGRARTVVPAVPATILGRIVRIKDRELTISPPDDKAENVTVLVAPDAEVVLNKEPARLTDLQPSDLTRVTMSNEMAGVADSVWAARVTEDPPPNFQITGPAPRRPIREPVEPYRPTAEPPVATVADNQGGLGVILFDSPGVGVLVTAVYQGSPAERAGIQAGDYLVAVGLREVVTPTDFIKRIAEFLPESEVQLTVWRLGEPSEMDVILTRRQAAPDRVVTNLFAAYVEAAAAQNANRGAAAGVNANVNTTGQSAGAVNRTPGADAAPGRVNPAVPPDTTRSPTGDVNQPGDVNVPPAGRGNPATVPPDTTRSPTGDVNQPGDVNVPQAGRNP